MEFKSILARAWNEKQIFNFVLFPWQIVGTFKFIIKQLYINIMLNFEYQLISPVD